MNISTEQKKPVDNFEETLERYSKQLVHMAFQLLFIRITLTYLLALLTIENWSLQSMWGIPIIGFHADPLDFRDINSFSILGTSVWVFLLTLKRSRHFTHSEYMSRLLATYTTLLMCFSQFLIAWFFTRYQPLYIQPTIGLPMLLFVILASLLTFIALRQNKRQYDITDIS